MNNNFRNKITYINYILSILIVCLHSDNVHMLSDTMKGSRLVYYFENAITTFARIAVPCFFVISAYLFYKSFDMSKLYSKYKSRFKSLFIPYIIWSGAAFAYIAILSNVSFFSSKMNMGRIELTLSNILKSILLSEYAPLWFVRNLMILVLIAPIIYYIIKRKMLTKIIVILFIAINLLFKTDYYAVIYWVPLYLTGAYLGHYYSKKIEEEAIFSRKSKVISAILFSIVFIFAYLYENATTMYIFRLVVPFTLWVLIDSISFDKKPKWWMEISFFIYCTHFVIISSLQKIMLLVLGKSTLAFLITYLITPIIVILIITFAAYIMKRYIPSVWKFTTGGR